MKLNRELIHNILTSGINENNPDIVLKIRFINVLTIIGVFGLFIYGISYLRQGNLFIGIFEIVMGVVGILNFVGLRVYKRVELASIISIVISGTILLILLIDGGIETTGAFWIGLFPILSYYLRGTRSGLIWNSVLLSLIGILVIFQEIDILKLPYSNAILVQLILFLIFLSALIFLYEYMNEKFVWLYKSKTFELKTILKTVEIELQKREAAEKKLREQNDSLEDTKIATLNILEDLEEEKSKLKEEKDKVDTIIQSIGDGVFVLDRNYRIILYNKVCEALTGYPESEAVGKNYKDILDFHFDDTEDVNDQFIRDCLEKGEVTSMSNHTVLIKRDGQKIPVADSASPIRNKLGLVIGCVVVFRDVTKEREVDRAKTEFVSLASHQLRTPLTAIKWYVEILEDAVGLSDEFKGYLKEIHDGNERMVDLVNALLNTSRIDMGTFEIKPEPTLISDIADSVLKELEPLISEKSIQIEKTFGSELREYNLDQKLTRIIFQNLISNAVKYTPEKGRVNLSVKDENNIIKINVEDTGYGIPKDQQDKIFTKLFRADNIREKITDGTGLGLYIVKSIVDQSGGKIWFESEENKGTKFFVELPATGMTPKEDTKKLD